MDTSIHERRMILTGARRNFTGILGGHRVEKGVIMLRGMPRDILAWEHHIGLMWQGYPQGDPRIEANEQAIAAATGEASGQGHIQAGAVQSHGQEDIQGDQRQGLPGTNPGAADGAGNDGGASGVPDAGTPLGHGSPQELTAIPVNTKLRGAIERLDDAEPKHWTQAGLPMLTQVEKFYGSAGVTRAMIEGASDRRRKA